MFEFEHWHLVRIFVLLLMVGLFTAYAVLVATCKAIAARPCAPSLQRVAHQHRGDREQPKEIERPHPPILTGGCSATYR
jgi:hypothetical protein